MLSRNAYLVPSSQHPRVIDLDGVEILLHHQSGLYLAPSLESTTLFRQDNGVFTGEPSSAAAAENTLQRKPTAKRDRHSKINTAQGPRDRRVRLSIGIARKFFDLQEMLGFDKPSKTLDWLLTKSKEAIKDLVQTTQKASSSPSPSECDLVSSESGADLKREDKAGMDRQQSRAKARARARERTLERMCIKQLGGSAGSSSNNVRTNHSEAETPDLIEESLVIRRKSKNPSLFGFQQNLVFSREMDSSNYIIPSSNANENWDVFAFASHSILDQHKFANSNSNI